MCCDLYTRQDKRQDKTRQDETRQDKTRPDKTRQVHFVSGESRQAVSEQCHAWALPRGHAHRQCARPLLPQPPCVRRRRRRRGGQLNPLFEPRKAVQNKRIAAAGRAVPASSSTPRGSPQRHARSRPGCGPRPSKTDRTSISSMLPQCRLLCFGHAQAVCTRSAASAAPRPAGGTPRAI